MDPPRHNFCRNPGNVEVSPWCLVGPKNERESCGISRCSHVSAGRVLVASCGKDMLRYVSSCLIPRDRAVWGGGKRATCNCYRITKFQRASIIRYAHVMHEPILWKKIRDFSMTFILSFYPLNTCYTHYFPFLPIWLLWLISKCLTLVNPSSPWRVHHPKNSRT